MPGYFIYSRKSTEAEDRQVLSIDSQVSELRQTATRLGLPILDVLTEAKSAKAPGRPVFNAMMQRLYRGEAQGVLCWKLDRMARNPVDGGAVIWSIKQHSIKVVTPAQTFGQADDNVILMYIEFGMAQKYIDDLSKNVKRGLKAKAEKGWYPGVAPLGYLNDHTKDQGERDVVIDPDRFALVRRMWDLMLTGRYAPPAIARMANEQWGFRTRPMPREGGKPLARSGIYRLFADPFYYGWFEYPKGSGQWYRGGHRAMVSEEEFNRVQVLMGRTGSPRPAGHKAFAFTGLIRCGGCGGMVTAEEKHQLICGACRLKFACRAKDRCPGCSTPIAEMERPTFLAYTYYHCAKSKDPRCRERCVEVRNLERQVEGFLSRIQLSERFARWAIRYLDELHASEASASQEIAAAQQRAYEACCKRLANLVRLKTSPENADGSLLSDVEYGTQRLDLLKEKARLEETLGNTQAQAERRRALAAETFEFAREVRQRFAKGDAEAKRQIVATLGSNLTLKDKILMFDAKKQFSILEQSLCGARQVSGTLEPETFEAVQGQNGRMEPHCLTGCGQKDEARTYDRPMQQMVRAVYAFFGESILHPPSTGN
ncbi:MAG: recombinase family protein [Verrucomicrobia bacterium]|nr:recombinase family protein [Verrucomicrobiota bacterium]